MELHLRNTGALSLEKVDDENPLPVKLNRQVVVSAALDSGYVIIPDIGTGAAYADGDAFGTTVTFPNMVRSGLNSGIVYSAAYLDLDDEGLAIDMHIFKDKPTYVPTDNGAYNPTDADLIASGYLCTVQFITFSNFGSNQVSFVPNIGRAFAGASGQVLYGQCVARGALNIAAGNIPRVSLQVLAD